MTRVQITCKGSEELSLNEIVPLQGDLKDLSEANYQKLRASILDLGFTAPFFIWRSEGINYATDGHQRLKTVQRMISEGIEFPEKLPVVITEAKNRAEAKRKILAISSNYGTMTEKGLLDFAADIDLGLDEIMDSFQFDGLDIEKMLGEVTSEGETPCDRSRGTMVEQYLVPPFSILDARLGYWKKRKDHWLGIGIKSEEGRADNLLGHNEKLSAKHGMEGKSMSIFDPALAEIAYSWFSPKGGVIVDPFAGGSVRGVVASRTGRHYMGHELREEQVLANREQAKQLCSEYMPTWCIGDSRNIASSFEGLRADMLFTCPPYADLEVYSDDPADISNMGYADFMEAYREIISESCKLLKDDSFACVVVGEVRDSKGNYYNFVGDTIKAFIDAGLEYYNEAIYITPNGTLAMRAGGMFRASRKLGKGHQNVLVFVKGDGKRAAVNCGHIEVMEVDNGEEEA